MDPILQSKLLAAPPFENRPPPSSDQRADVAYHPVSLSAVETPRVGVVRTVSQYELKLPPLEQCVWRVDLGVHSGAFRQRGT